MRKQRGPRRPLLVAASLAAVAIAGMLLVRCRNSPPPAAPAVAPPILLCGLGYVAEGDGLISLDVARGRWALGVPEKKLWPDGWSSPRLLPGAMRGATIVTPVEAVQGGTLPRAALRQWRVRTGGSWLPVRSVPVGLAYIGGATSSPGSRWTVYWKAVYDDPQPGRDPPAGGEVWLADWQTGKSRRIVRRLGRPRLPEYLACSDRGDVYVRWALDGPAPFTCYRADGTQQEVGVFDQVLTTTTGNYGIRYENPRGGIAFHVRNLDDPTAPTQRYAAPFHDRHIPGFVRGPRGLQVVCSDDGVYWAADAVDDRLLFIGSWTGSLFVWRRGHSEPVYTFPDNQYQILPIGLRVLAPSVGAVRAPASLKIRE